MLIRILILVFSMSGGAPAIGSEEQASPAHNLPAENTAKTVSKDKPQPSPVKATAEKNSTKKKNKEEEEPDCED